MKIITINLAEPHVKALQVLQDLGLYPSRSEAIRVAIRDFLQRRLGFSTKLEFEDDPATVRAIPMAVPVVDKKAEIARLLRKLRDEQPDLKVVA